MRCGLGLAGQKVVCIRRVPAATPPNRLTRQRVLQCPGAACDPSRKVPEGIFGSYVRCVADHQGASKSGLTKHRPNKGMQATAYSVRSAPASRRA